MSLDEEDQLIIFSKTSGELIRQRYRSRRVVGDRHLFFAIGIIMASGILFGIIGWCIIEAFFFLVSWSSSAALLAFSIIFLITFLWILTEVIRS